MAGPLAFLSSAAAKTIVMTITCGCLGHGLFTASSVIADLEQELSASQILWAFLTILTEYKLYVFCLIEISFYIFWFIVSWGHSIAYGEITTDELQQLQSSSLSYVFFKCVVMTTLLDQYWPECVVWASYFALVWAGKSFVSLGRKRFKNLHAQGVLDASIFRRHSICLFWVCCYHFVLACVPLILFFEEIGWHPCLLFVLDSFQVFLQALTVLLNYVIYLRTIEQPDQWPYRDSCNHGIELVGVCIVEIFHIINLIYIWSYQFLCFTLLDLVLLQYLASAFMKLRQSIRTHRDYFAVIYDINNKYPDATLSDLEEDDVVCTICQDNVTEGKKLPCGHIFHLKCLQDWMRYKQICPTCRSDLKGGENQNSQREPEQNRGWSFSWGLRLTSWFNFRVRAVRTTNIDEQVTRVHEIFPHESMNLIRADILETGSAEAAIDRAFNRQEQAVENNDFN